MLGPNILTWDGENIFCVQVLTEKSSDLAIWVSQMYTCGEDMLWRATIPALPDESLTGCGDEREQSAERPKRCLNKTEGVG